MAILEYDDKYRVHPEGWIGIRISVLGATQEYKSKYYNFGDRSTGKLKPEKEIERMREGAYNQNIDAKTFKKVIKEKKV